MPLEAVVQFYYDEGSGPTRQGITKKKPSLHASLDGSEGVEDLLRMMEGVCEWGQVEFGRDHGTESDHKLLLNMMNLVLDLVPGAYEIAAQQFRSA